MMNESRKTFPKITLQSHPEAAAAAFTPESTLAASDSDRIIVDEIIAILKKGSSFLGKSDGEWKYLDSQRRSTYISRIRYPRNDELSLMFANMFRNDATYGIATPSYVDVDSTIKDQILLDLDACLEFSSCPDTDTLLFDPVLGNPFGLLKHQKVLSPDSPRHYYFADKLMKLAATAHGKKIVEIGGGYGGLALMVQRLNRGAPYVIVDLFETCLLQYYFLRKAGFEVTFAMSSHEAKDAEAIVILPTEISEDFLSTATDVGVVFNSRSLSEMALDTVDQYLTWIQHTLKPDFIHHENSNFLLFPESVRHLEILAADFPVDEKTYRLSHMNISPFLGGGGRYREFLYERISLP